MLEKLKDMPSGIDGLRAVGKLSKEDYDEVMEPLLAGARREDRRLRFLYQLGPDFDGFTAGAAWEDAKLGLHYMRLFEACASRFRSSASQNSRQLFRRHPTGAANPPGTARLLGCGEVGCRTPNGTWGARGCAARRSLAKERPHPMSRSTLIYLLIAGGASGAACDKSGSETEAKIGEAKTTLTSAVVEAGAGAAAEVESAQVAAETRISYAEADFATTREDYRHKIQSDLDSVDHKVDVLDAKAGAATGMVKTRLSATLLALRRQRDAFVKDLHAIDNDTADTWDAAKARLDKELAELKAAVDRAS